MLLHPSATYHVELKILTVVYSPVRREDVIMTQAGSYCPIAVEAQIWSQASLYGICGVQKGSGTCFLRVLQFSPTSIIPQMLHTHISFTYTTDAVADDSATKISLFSLACDTMLSGRNLPVFF